MKRFHIIVKGKVQGVFYRDNTQKKASELGLNGYVKNLPDGTVEIIAEGDEDKLNQLVNFCKTNPGYSNVTIIEIKELKPSNEFNSFEVRY